MKAALFSYVSSVLSENLVFLMSYQDGCLDASPRIASPTMRASVHVGPLVSGARAFVCSTCCGSALIGND